jgi:hypothetical protein
MTQQTERKVRDNLTDDEKARLEKYGAVMFKSARSAWDPGAVTGAVVTGVAGIDEIGPGVVRVSYFMEFEESHDGDRERKIVDYQIWSLPQLMDNLLVMQKALKEMRAMRGQPKLVQAAGMH